MTFISYAQNFEDVMLWRALKHVENGFYIDVGANDPTLYSVTRAFYDRGWRGINLEPVTQFFERLQKERPRDINLQISAGASNGSFPFFDIPDTGLATSNTVIAQTHRDQGWNVHQIEVQVQPLAEICNRHVTGDIHFLKIDVEGAEKEVLLGMDFKRWRPWIVVIEATLPMSRKTVHESWDSLIVGAGYEYVYFDGLNRYYVANEHAEIKPAFTIPPNVFDDFVLNTDEESRLRIAEAEARAQQAQLDRNEAVRHRAEAERMRFRADESARLAIEHLHASEAAVQDVTRRLQQTEQLIAQIYATKSWRVTAPLRWAKANSGRMKNAAREVVTSPRSFALRVARYVLRRSIPVVKANPLLMTGANQFRRVFPEFTSRLIHSMRQPSPAVLQMQRSPLALVQSDPPAWGETLSSAERFEAALKRELKRREPNKH